MVPNRATHCKWSDVIFSVSQQPSAIEIEVKAARDRFDDIVTVLESRGVNLEATLTQSEQYQVTYNNVVAWLDCVEECQANWKSIGSDLNTVRKQYAEFQVRLTEQKKMKYSIKNFFSKCDQIRSFVRF